MLPEGASADDPAPLLLWIHGGPLLSWNDWRWRWNPWIMAQHGYAVLLPDPACPPATARTFIDRGWGDWGAAPYADLMAITDAALARPDIDATRTAAMGGSFGGYMANWIAGHTDRFKAIVTHACLWDLDQFAGTTDAAGYWQREFGVPRDRALRAVLPAPRRRSPRRCWSSTATRTTGCRSARRCACGGTCSAAASSRSSCTSPTRTTGSSSRGNAVVWYETVLAFLGQHVLGQEWKRAGVGGPA